MTTHEVIERFDQHRRKIGLRGFIADVVMLAIVLSLGVAVAAEPTMLTQVGDKDSVQAEAPTPESNLQEIQELQAQNNRQARLITALQEQLESCTNGETVACYQSIPYDNEGARTIPVLSPRTRVESDGSDEDTVVVVEDDDKAQPQPRDTTPPRVSSPITDPLVSEIREKLDDTLNIADEATENPLLDDLPVDLGGR